MNSQELMLIKFRNPEGDDDQAGGTTEDEEEETDP